MRLVRGPLLESLHFCLQVNIPNRMIPWWLFFLLPLEIHNIDAIGLTGVLYSSQFPLLPQDIFLIIENGQGLVNDLIVHEGSSVVFLATVPGFHFAFNLGHVLRSVVQEWNLLHFRQWFFCRLGHWVVEELTLLLDFYLKITLLVRM